MEIHRPSPEKVLKKFQEDERKAQRGKLKIYLGAAPGVGKTYTMLEDALEKRRAGLDVVVGIAESHGREEIKAFLKKFEILPKQTVTYRDRQFLEFDLDAALKRNPVLLLVDEMAHTNLPGLRHAKRWQDIKELLDRGIDVYTTLNVQHLESLNDVVAEIIGAHVRETVPDFMLEEAETVEVIDLPPEELLKRLHEGKVYFPKQAEIAKENYFREGNLIALRELALRVTAERVEKEAFLYRQDLGIKQIWPIKEKFLVCVGPNPESAKVIREARRMAKNFDAQWIAVYVDRPKMKSSEESRKNAIQNLRLAEQLGADTRILFGMDVVKEVMTFAREQNVTTIVIGKLNRPKWKEFFRKRLADEIIRHSEEISVHVITSESEQKKIPKKIAQRSPIPWKVYGIAVGVITLITMINLIFQPYVHERSLVLLYLLGVIIVALFGSIGPSILATLLSVFAHTYFFVPPLYSLTYFRVDRLFALIMMLIVSLTISYLTILLKRQSGSAKFAERQLTTLHTLSRQLASIRGVDNLLLQGITYIGDLFDSEVTALLPEKDHLTIHARYKTDEILDEKEQGIVQWVYDLGQIAGLGTDTLSFMKALYMPLIASRGIIGVFKIRPIEDGNLFTSEQMHLLESCLNQIATAIEVDLLQEVRKISELKIKEKEIRDALLKSVSHSFRKPLAGLMADASQIQLLTEHPDVQLVAKNIYLESEQLSYLINNLLQITYLETNRITLQKELHSLNDIILLVLNTATTKLDNRVINLQLEENLPYLPLDEGLMRQVVVNLLDNALKFTPPDTPILITTTARKNEILFSIEDQGPGILHEERLKLFKKYYQGQQVTPTSGLGLGLAICQKIISFHGGNIWVENIDKGGAVFYFTLPYNAKTT